MFPLTKANCGLPQAKEVAAESAAAEARAAAAALRAVEAGIALYAERRDYLKLKDIAEASDVAGKVGGSGCSFARLPLVYSKGFQGTALAVLLRLGSSTDTLEWPAAAVTNCCGSSYVVELEHTLPLFC